VVKTPRGHPG